MRYRLATALAATLITLVGFASAGGAQSEAPAPEAGQPEAPTPEAGQPEMADGRTHPGPYFLGRADAPVTLEEYADFQ